MSLAKEAAHNAAGLKGKGKRGRPPSRTSSTTTRTSRTLKSDDEYSGLDISIPPSLASPPDTSNYEERIKMTNMYVERIFRSFRQQKSSSQFKTKSKLFVFMVEDVLQDIVDFSNIVLSPLVGRNTRQSSKWQ